MASLSAESIKQVTDPAKLQEICITLAKIREKETESKKKYHQAAAVLQQQLEAQKMENKCLQDKVSSLIEFANNNPDSDARVQELEQKILLLEKTAMSNADSETELFHMHQKVLELEDIIRNQAAQINSLKAEKIEMEQKCISILDTNKAKAKEKISQMKAEYQSLVVKLNKTQSKYDSLLASQRECSELSADEANKLQCELTDLRSKINLLEEQKSDLSKSNERLNTLYSENAQTIATLNATLTEKNETISKLKTLLTRSVHSEQRYQSQINELQMQVSDLTGKVVVSTTDFDLLEKLSAAESECKRLSEQLINNEASAELRTQNKKLKEMIDKSNSLYTQMQAEYSSLMQKHQKDLSLNSCVIFDRLTKTKSSTKSRGSIKATEEYFKRAVLQYFTEDEDQKTQMIPIILDLAGCTKEQINAVMRQKQREKRFKLFAF